MPSCLKGIFKSGVFYEEGTGREIPVRILKGISIPENKLIYIQLLYGYIAIGYAEI